MRMQHDDSPLVPHTNCVSLLSARPLHCLPHPLPPTPQTHTRITRPQSYPSNCHDALDTEETALTAAYDKTVEAVKYTSQVKTVFQSASTAGMFRSN